jgi:hypothetical protein
MMEDHAEEDSNNHQEEQEETEPLHHPTMHQTQIVKEMLLRQNQQ